MTKGNEIPRIAYEVIEEIPLHAGGIVASHAEIRARHADTGEEVGNLILEFPDQHGQRGITAINVIPQSRRRGVATALFEHAERVGLRPSSDSVFYTPAGRSFVESIRANRPGRGQLPDTAGLAEQLARDNQRLGPSLPGYHWHSVARARGWEQPTLDGRDGGEDPTGWLQNRTRAEERKPPSTAAARSTSRPR